MILFKEDAEQRIEVENSNEEVISEVRKKKIQSNISSLLVPGRSHSHSSVEVEEKEGGSMKVWKQTSIKCCRIQQS